MRHLIEPLRVATAAGIAEHRRVGRTGFRAVVIALVWLVSARSHAACQVQSVELPVTMVGSRAVATVGINDTPVKLVLDSGAFYSMLTEAAAQQLKLPLSPLPFGFEIHGVTGEMDAQRTTVKRLQLLHGEIPDVEFVVGGNEPGGGALGLLGRNFLAMTDIEYDLAHGVVRFMVPSDDCSGANMAYWAGKTPVSELTLRRDSSKVPAILANGVLNGKDVKVEFDTGATSLVTLDAAHRAGVTDAEMVPDGVVFGVGEGRAKLWVAPIRKFEIGGEVIANNRLRVADLDMKFDQGSIDMLLGIDFFLSHRIYIAKHERRMFFTYNGGPVFAHNTVAAEADSASGAAGTQDAGLPKDAAGYAQRAAVFIAQRDFDHALTDLDRACELAPQVAENFAWRGVVHLALAQRAQAAQDFDTALRLDPAQADARLQRAGLRSDAGDRDGALEDMAVLDSALAPQANFRLALAQIYAKLDLPEQALKQWALWIPAHPHQEGLASVLNSRCWTRTLLGVDLDKARDDCDQAIDLQPDNAAFIDSRAWLRLRRSELRDALADFNRSLKLRPDLASSLYGRGIVRRRLGDEQQGNSDLEAARKLSPGIDTNMARYGLASDSKP